MQDIFGSVRRSLVFRSTSGEDGGVGVGGLVEKIGSSIRKSRIGLFGKPSLRALPPIVKTEAVPIRWRKGELIGCGAFGRVYMGMNLDSGELLAIKQVLIAASSASKEKTQAHMRELEEEVELLKNLTHPNIVGTRLQTYCIRLAAGTNQESHLVFRNSIMESGNLMATSGVNLRNSMIRQSTCSGLKDICKMGSVRCSTVYPEHLSAGSNWGANNFDDDMCQIDNKDDFGVRASVKFNSTFNSADLNKSFNPMCEPTDDWPCKFDESTEVDRYGMNLSSGEAICGAVGSAGVSNKEDNDFSFPCSSSAPEDDDEVTE